MRFSFMAISLAALTLLRCPAADAAEAGDQPWFSVAGFGTVGATRSNDKHADFIGAYYQPNGPGHTREWSTDTDTVFALQGKADISPRLSAVVQIVVDRQWRNAYVPTVEWANVRYAFTPDFSVRVGRSILPMFLTSDSRKIGYTNAWVRPPYETYSVYEFSNSDGIDATYRFHLGQTTHTATAIYGKNDVISPDGTPEGWNTKVQHFVGLVDRIERGPLTFQVAYGKAEAFYPQQASDPDPDVAALSRFAFNVATFGASYDSGNWFVVGERARIRAPGQSLTSWHIGAGYRWRDWTPYVIHSERGPLNGSLVGSDSTAQTTDSIGIRWDFAKNMDLKVQFDRIRTAPGSSGLFINMQPDFLPSIRANLVTVALDFVF